MMGIRRRRALLPGSTMLGMAALLGGAVPALFESDLGRELGFQVSADVRARSQGGQ